MFRVAQWIVRHKVLVVGVGAAAFIFTNAGNKQPEKPANPWSARATEQVASAASDKTSFTEKAVHAVAGGVKSVTGMDMEQAKDANDKNWSAATDATKKAAEAN